LSDFKAENAKKTKIVVVKAGKKAENGDLDNRVD